MSQTSSLLINLSAVFHFIKPYKNTNKKNNRVNLKTAVFLQDSLQDGEALSKQSGKRRPVAVEANGKSRNRERLRDFYEECVEMSTGLESGLDQQKWFKASSE